MKNTISFFILSILFVFVACDNDTNGLNYNIPTTYDFQNVNYSGQTARLDMLDEMTVYMKSANTQGVVLDAQLLLEMYANDNNAFDSDELNNAGKQIKNKTFSGDVDKFEERISRIALASTSTVTGVNGIAGVVSTESRDVLLDENGVELTQLIEKGLMGACFFYQISEVYTREDKIGEIVNNTEVTEGEGTDMEHHWDEAFGYFGAPIDFPENTEAIRFWAKYTNGRDAILNCNKTIMDAYIAGRAAISNNDDEAKWANASIIRNEIERVSAATAIHYLNSAISNYADIAERCHVLSEAQAFLESTKYHADGKLNSSEIENILSNLGGNFYETTISQINTTKDLISDKYDLGEYKDVL